MAMRAAGHGLKVCFIQIIKGSWKYGELEAVKQFEDLIEFHVMGKGFTWKSKDKEEDIAAGRKAWEFARKAIASERFHLIVLDEFTYLLKYGIVDLKQALATLIAKPAELHIIVTGRGAPEELLTAADMVTEMRSLKHPLQAGIKAQRGIEF